MDSLELDYPDELLKPRRAPCLSLYQPTARRRPENAQDPIRFRNLLGTLEASLEGRTAPGDVRALLAPFEALAEDAAFWNTTHEGLAVLGAAGFFRVYRLARPVPELANVADSFHTKPLMRILQSADRFQVLGLDRQGARLFEGDRDRLEELEPAPGVPRTIGAALGEELTEPHRTVASYGAGAGGAAMHHGHGGKADEVDVDTERWFRAIDRAVLEHHSRPSGLPLVLAALPEHHAPFRAVSHNPSLLEEAVDVHPDAMTVEELRDRAWRAVEPRHRARLDGLVERFGTARAQGLASEDPTDVAEAAVAGRVDTLLIAADRRLPGRIDTTTGSIETGDLAESDVDDVLDDLGEIVLRAGGDLVVLPEERMPTSTGAAAVHRY